MGDDIEINVTETTNIIEITPQPNDQIVDISVIDNAPNVELNITPSVIEINVTRGSSTAIWGAITGNIDDQTDLATKFGLKADLVDGKVPSSQLPSYVDDVIEVANYAALPITGETGKIYITLDNNKVFRWSGSTYIEIAANNAIWGAITGTLSSQTDLQTALNAKFNNPTGDTTQYLAGDGTLITFPTILDSGNLICLVRNQSGATIAAGSLVYISSGSGNKPLISLSQANTEGNSSRTFGMVRNSIANNANGYVVINGQVTDLNTSAFTEGNILYLSPTTAGGYTTTKPSAPNHLVYIGEVIYSHSQHGTIQTRIQNGYELDELHNVALSSLVDKGILTYEFSTSLWKNKSLGTIIGGTSSQFVKGDGSLDSSVYALDSAVVHLTGSESINGIKTFIGSSLILDPVGSTSILTFKGSGSLVAEFSFNSSYTQFSSKASNGYLFKNTASLNALTITDSGNGTFLGNLTSTAFIKSGGTSSQFLKADGSIDSSTYALTSQLHDAVTLGTTGILNGLSLSGQVLSLAIASSTTRGALTAEDYNYFFAKQAALSGTGFVKISGTTISYDNSTYLTASALTSYPTYGGSTTNYLPKYGGGSPTLINSLIYDNGTNVGIGTTSPSYKLDINGTFRTKENSLLGENTTVGNSSFAWGFPGANYGQMQNVSSTVYGIGFGGTPTTIGTTVLSYNTSGNVGIGTTSPSTILSVEGTNQISHKYNGGGGSSAPLYIGQFDSSGNVSINNAANADLWIGTNNSRAMTIKSGGVVCIGTTSAFDSGIVCSDGGTSYVPYTAKIGTTANSTQIFFRNPNGVVGSISTSGSVTLFNSSSDYRLKQDLKNINGLDLVSKIKVYDYEWKSDKSRSYGVLAHELQEVVPQAVTGEKDGEQMQSVDYSKLVPILVQAIQELKAEIEILKAK
jgi:hypothetical protein